MRAPARLGGRRDAAAGVACACPDPELLQALEQRGALGVELFEAFQEPVAHVEQLLGRQRAPRLPACGSPPVRGQRRGGQAGEGGLEGGDLVAELPGERAARAPSERPLGPATKVPRPCSLRTTPSASSRA